METRKRKVSAGRRLACDVITLRGTNRHVQKASRCHANCEPGSAQLKSASRGAEMMMAETINKQADTDQQAMARECSRTLIAGGSRLGVRSEQDEGEDGK